ncbi:MAG: Smr/MutS family protein, partial [Bacteroidales bacterium]|nr:Smr/MutS family protein [Bacteroidales bacterium]
VVNGAMQFDASTVAPLFQLETGLPGSSFAFELARKMGLPEAIVKDAEERAGEEFVGIERNLRKIARNRRALDEKLTRIRQTDKALESITDKYQKELAEIKQQKKDILEEARREAEAIVKDANREVEKTIRTIKEARADKEQTKEARKELQNFVSALQQKKSAEQKTRDEYIDRKLAQLSKRRERWKGRDGAEAPEKENFRGGLLKVGEKVRIKDNGMVGEVSKVSAKAVTIIIGSISSKLPPERVERISSNEFKAAAGSSATPPLLREDSSIRERKLRFRTELDVRGERLSDALDIVTHYIDDAIMVGVPSVRIIHGKGTGVLRDEIQKYLRTVPGVASAKDESIQLGGSGVTVVTFD